MPANSYRALAHNERHLKGIGDAAASPSDGITQNDLLEAEAMAKNTIDGWLLAVCGGVRGKAIVDEFEAAASDLTIDPAIRDVADLLASAIVWDWYEKRNTGNVSRADTPILRSVTLREQATAEAAKIERAGKLLKADKTVRRLRYAALEQGVAGGGPLYGKTYFPTPDDLEPEDV